MSVLKKLINYITIKSCGDKIGYLFNNPMLNVTTSGVGIGFTGANCGRSLFKGIASPTPWCKGLYFTAAALNGISCASSTICLASGCSCIGILPLGTGSLAYAASVTAQCCNALADCMDPAASLTAKGVDACINLATKTCS